MNARLVLLLPVALTLSACSNLFFYPAEQLIRTPADIDLAYEEVYLDSDGHRLHGWLLPAAGETRGTVLFAHGNAENISTHIGSVYWLPEHGYRVFLFDYRGYGRSEGKPSIEGVVNDVQSAIAYLQTTEEAAGSGMVVYGQSLGGSVAVSAVAGLDDRRSLEGVIVDSAFAGYRDIAREKMQQWWLTWPLSWPLSLLFPGQPDPVDDIARLSPLPVLVMHGTDDRIIPPAHGRRLYEAAREPRALWLLPGTGHNHGLQSDAHRQKFLGYLEEFFAP